jgi:hypothetical protein
MSIRIFITSHKIKRFESGFITGSSTIFSFMLITIESILNTRDLFEYYNKDSGVFIADLSPINAKFVDFRSSN